MDGRPVYERTLTESQLLEQLPSEIANLIRSASGTQLLHALALGALNTEYTESVLRLYEPIVVDLAARWLRPDLNADPIHVLAAFARILPFATYLRPFASQYAFSQAGPLSALAGSKELTLRQLDPSSIRSLLLALFRLLSFDLDTFSKTVSPIQLQSLFPHEDRVIRYLAVRCFAIYMHAADAATGNMLRVNTGVDPIEGEWEGITIDYRLLGLWEERRWETLQRNIRHASSSRSDSEVMELADRTRDALTARSADVCGILIPRLKDAEPTSSSIVKTPTTTENLRRIARSLLSTKPILLIGLPNSGKTSLINDIAGVMGQAESMVTLHLNEQTDAKSLLGMYATSSATGSFSWQPGVLTKAAREGRWVLIEDLDRAPSEVLGLILPIIERGELTIASRRERIKCAEGFKIIATMKSSYNIAGEEVAPSTSMLGSRLWQRVPVASLSVGEMRDVILQKFPLLESRVPIIMEIYRRVCSAFHGSLAIKGSQGRTPGFRDLIKLCSRLHRRLQRMGAKTGFEASPEGVEDEILLDVVDIFLKYLPEKSMQSALASVVAEALQISPQRAQFCLDERTPNYIDKNNSLILGREVLQKIKVPSGAAQKLAAAASRFASTRSALHIMEQVAASVQMAEPVLLVGETGIGKTTVIQQLATLMRQKLTVVNLSQQSESTDLLGGFKPVSIRTMAVPMLDEFIQLFELTFSAKKNQKFLSSVSKCVASGNWVRLVNLWHEAVRLANGVFNPSRSISKETENGDDQQPAKKRKLDSPKYQHLRQRWESFDAQLADFEAQVSQGDAKFAFAFVQGKIVRALRNGEWVLLDEVNLASPDTLENIASLLHHGSEGSPSVLLSEAGDVERVFGHPDFRIFGAMNPATDAGKRDLPPGLRSRFTEFYVHSPDSELNDLLALIEKYLGNLTMGDPRVVPDLAQLYMETKKLSNANKLTDGAGQRPHFSIRTLVRSLIYVIDHAHVYGLRRAIFEGFSMSFLTVLSLESERSVIPLLEKHIFENAKNAKSLLGRTPRPPEDGHDYVHFKHYWMRRGPLLPEEQPHYIITPFIEKNLKNLVRASSTRRFPVLLQGPTSAGKTSMIEYLAKVSGNKFVRINNHEHTDLQEYLGSYISSDDGSLRYQEGVLVEALRNGYWIVLDELNLAPSDVLEALNRLLDDNRELFIPETQEVVHPHPNFMLFATQNPAGLYGGRKVLSRAFRNRFLELHFDDIPESELEYILKERSQIAPSFCTKIVSVYRKLSLLRQSNRLFEQKNSFATLRDLFRWALRDADDREQLAVNGFMLLGERVRNPQEKAAVKSVIEEVMKVRLDEDVLYSESQLKQSVPQVTELPPGIVWTKAMRRLFILVSKALRNNEPVLLVGETGCGKTQLCQAVAEAFKRELFIVNAHVNLETGDLIGAQRPIRNRAAIERKIFEDLQLLLHGEHSESGSIEQLKQEFAALDAEQRQDKDQDLLRRIEKNITRCNALFEWSDGSLINAMKTGQFFLLDEISLADDSVLERLNSVLEPHRSILLAEKGPVDSMVVADGGFQFLSTMNPGGDYGKRELSAALRNRMTEIWAPQLSEDEDILPILQMRSTLQDEEVARSMLQFAKWFKTTFHNTSTTSLSLRDLLAWVDFVNTCQSDDTSFAIIQGAAMVFVDTLGANPAAMLAISLHNLDDNRQKCLDKLSELFSVDASNIYRQSSTVSLEPGFLQVGPFSLPTVGETDPDPQFTMDAPTTIANSVRIARGLQSSKPILMEGSPGVGKTTLVTALARALGKPLTRINLSEQTDLTDLFGSDVPVEGGDVGQFTWRDAPFLRAMQRGDWVLLDEMNLASQSVLEGLNSCLDHRQQVYIAELDQTFKRHPDFVLFAAQNPHHQGGGRKGLPASFVNRFTVVYADSFTDADLKRICAKLFPGSPASQTERLVDFISSLNTAIVTERRLGAVGGPWEVNLRDIQRWLQLADRGDLQIPTKHFLDIVISQRFRSQDDRALVAQIYDRIFTDCNIGQKSYFHNLTPAYLQVGLGILNRDCLLQRSVEPHMKILPNDLNILESLILCIDNSWPSILVGPAGCGKTTLIKKLAAINGANLEELALSADTDTMDLIGGFEQIDHRREISSLIHDVDMFLRKQIIHSFASGDVSESVALALQICQHFQSSDTSLETVVSSLSELCQSFPDPTLQQFLERAQTLWETIRNTDKMKVGFEWTEGVLTRAVQNGSWVILDNANLCNPSVLDRLNSLTEPNGTLILNEQRTEDGSARIITPHPNFRLFMTMDPRHGELSRAMRNRCIEICFMPCEIQDFSTTTGPSYLCESALYRLRHIWSSKTALPSPSSSASMEGLFEICLDHLSPADLVYLQKSPGTYLPNDTESDVKRLTASNTLQRYSSMLHENAHWRPLNAIPDEIIMAGASLSIKGGLQPVHPLVNEPLLSITGGSHYRSSVIVLAYLEEFRLEIHRLRQRLVQSNDSANQLKPSQMTRLERSLASSRIQPLMKDTTQPVGNFLSDCGQALYDYIQGLDEASLQSPEIVAALRTIICLCWDIYTATDVNQVNEGEFQVYLQIGRRVCASLLSSSPSMKTLQNALSGALARFQAGWALTTGLSMQRIWDVWRHVTPSSQEQLMSLIELESTVSDFTNLALQTRVELSDLSNVWNSLINAQKFILLDGADGDMLLEGIKQTVAELGKAVRRSDSTQYPYFSQEFEAICQYHDIASFGTEQAVETVVPLLAGRRARSLDSSTAQSRVPELLHRVALFSGAGKNSSSPLAIGGVISLSLLDRLTSVGTTTLGQMDMLQAEKQVLSRAISMSSRQVATEQSSNLTRALAALTAELVSCHREFFERESAERLISVLRSIELGKAVDNGSLVTISLDESLGEDHFFKSLAQKALPALVNSLAFASRNQEIIRSTGFATVQLAVILLRLFVPDKAFDPSLGLVVQRKRYYQRLDEISAKSNAILSFESTFSGQPSNLRSVLLQEEIQELGSAPPPSSVTRPEQSELSLLHGEFLNLINSVLNRNPEAMVDSPESISKSQETVQLLRDNIAQLSSRLSTYYRSYDDITVPVVRFLQLLDVGLFLASSLGEQSEGAQDIQSLSERTPFLGGTLHPILFESNIYQPPSQSNAIEMRLHELSAIWAAKDADPTMLQVKSGRDTIRRIFVDFHHLWKTQLREDQEKEAEKSELYRYRGSWEDEEEVDEAELNQLFPTYDGGASDPQEVGRIDPRLIAVRLSSLHAKIVGSQCTGEALPTFVKESGRLLGSMWSANKSPFAPVPPQHHLPSVFLLLEEVIGEESHAQQKNYNFYTDSNFAEARRLVNLTLSVQSRFAQIQTAWPEHAVLQDVITCCSEILQFKHIEPVAKFLTKVEKLHSLVHEWQLVASREYSAVPLYDEITNMTIGWRRLELSTWAKLLDLEKERCDENVSSWWFVAYEALLAVPLQIAECGEDNLSEHIEGVISTLEQFFKSTTLGQFTRRLQLVSDFQALLVAFVNDFPSLTPLVSALNNFLSHFRPFEPSVDKILQEKRSALEKDIKEQIQLASWKDTNIVALKESARRSHVKLFKLVRKYREALAQPIQPVLEQGLPEFGDGICESCIEDNNMPTALFPEVLSICQKNEKLWSSRALRFQNPDGTARNMTNLYSSIPSEFDIAKDLDGFTVSIIEGINEFKSQTPKTLTEENKDDVQHLKIQKRRLYAETLKRLFAMGVKRNAGTGLIETQVSLAQVLSTSAAFESSTTASSSIQSADSYFHRLLDLLPRARLASRNYSEELSNVEVSRSMGSIEYLLFVLRRQRGVLAPTLSDLGALKSTLDKARHLWTIGSDSLIKAGASASDELMGLTRVVAWLSPILALASTIIEVHSKFSGLQASSISQELKSRRAAFDDIRKSLQSHPSLPSGIASTIQKELIQRAWSLLHQLDADLKIWVQDRPDLSFALDQIVPWIQTNSIPSAGLLGKGTVSIQSFDDSLLSAVDKMLVGLQQLKDVPTAITFDGLMSRSDEFFSRASRAVHLNEITSSFDEVLGHLQNLQDKSASALSMAAALVTSILPIANKYYHICQDLTGRFISVHREICKTSYILTKTFTQLASEGFCSPAEASQDEGKEGKMESGTGLGDGEGAEDISKDVGDDEDLSELAQQAEKEDADKDEMDDSADAVNMDQEEMEGETGEHQEEGDEEEKDDNDDEEDNIDEEVGSVDDLDSGAVDEKLWDGANDEQQKETENEEGKGQAEEDQQAAAQEQKQEGEEGQKGEEEDGDEEDEEEEAPDDEGEAVGREDMDVTDPQTKEEETLDLPDEMQLDGNDQDGGDEGEDDDGMDDLDDMGPLPEEEQQVEEQDDQAGGEDADVAPDEQIPGEDEEMGEEGEETNEGEGQEENEAGGEEPEEPEQDDFLAQRDDNEAAGDDVAPSDAVNGGLAADQDQNEDKGASGDAQQESGSSDPTASAEQQTGAAKESEESKRSRDAGGAEDAAPNEPQIQAFKKLGDILEQWHRRQKEVLNPSQEEEDSQPLPQDTDMADADFEHLRDDEDVADTQALGQANEDQAKGLDQNKAVESENQPGEHEALPDVSEEIQDSLDNQLQDEMQIDRENAPAEAQSAGAFIPGDQTSRDHADGAPGAEDVNEELDEVDSQLAAIHLSSTLPPLTPEPEARRLWSHYENATNDLSLSLTEQLRLILAPTMATKLRGDFRTGKRLNIKRIIPYIASQYKRDKIWMRRSIPSKRNYQIMLAVDDSKSMLESGSGQLAFETLALVAKSLSMLEAGDLCVLGFGNEDHVRVAHEFGKPFSSEAGMQVFQHFSYQQTGTNVRKLIADSIALFREARWKRSPGSGSADLWQLQLIISDGICEDHDTIRRLVRQALEERIMIVFIIVDAVKGSSILDLSQASFEADPDSNGEMKLRMKRYLEGFPFPYYLVVRDVRELPSVLATALKQWFAEVVDVSS
ncbi:Midasin [Penicillium canariense]|uniref:Midasin n=1 Tax=Penicillium canariense TaxID=189055 RepID=A0A9W9LU75_9EURO|nr:Midasin [Penicillium canariense]KAJ5175879.1 Midasin [Penicillium canariense]